jgi:hypothetical protein
MPAVPNGPTAPVPSLSEGEGALQRKPEKGEDGAFASVGAGRGASDPRDLARAAQRWAAFIQAHGSFADEFVHL